MDITVETSSLRTRSTPVSQARIPIRGHTVRDPGLDHNTAPTEDEDAAHVGRHKVAADHLKRVDASATNAFNVGPQLPPRTLRLRSRNSAGRGYG